MAKRKIKKKPARKPKRTRKPSIARTPPAVAACKEMFLKELRNGYSPGTAADHIDVQRATFYTWRKTDDEFNEAWLDAVEAGLDHLESRLYHSENEESVRFLLTKRRYDREKFERERERPQASVIVNITYEERIARLQRLGLAVPVIETDYDDDINITDDAPKASAR